MKLEDYRRGVWCALILALLMLPGLAHAALDSDRDGISNLQEKRDGTDPYDPSSALAWHPNDLPDFPRLVADQDRWDEVWQDVQDQTEPYYSFYRYAISRADSTVQEPQDYDYDTSVCLANARIARAAAIRYWGAGDPDDAAKAAGILANVDPIFEAWSYETIDHGGILVSQAIILMCQAYEILLVTGGFADGEAEAAADALMSLTETFHNFYVNRFRLWMMGVRNNHVIKFDAGVGYAALTFNQWPRAAEFINFGLTETIYWQLEIQNCPGSGCCPEGPNYLAYSSINYLPFFLAYHRFAQGESYPYKTSCAHRVWPLCAENIRETTDPLVDSRFVELHDWWLHLRMPNGYGPPLDDSNLHCFAMGVVAALSGDGRFRWPMDQGSHCRNYTGDLAWEQMMLWPDMPTVQEPTDDELLWVNEPAGQAVLRSGWEIDDLYLLLNAEHRKARVQGMGHEQPDATSFIVHALGEFFIIDSGYIGWDDRWHVAGPENHNLILIDGKGPPRGLGIGADSNAWLTEWEQAERLNWVTAESSWASHDLRRFAALVDNQYVAIADWVEGSGEHAFDWLAHTNAGGSTIGLFTLTDSGALVEHDGVFLHVGANSAPLQADLEEQEDEHGFGHGSIQTHSVLHAAVTTESPAFMALFVPSLESESAPVIHRLTPCANPTDCSAGLVLETDDAIDFWAAARVGGLIDQDLQSFGLPGIESDAEIAWVRFSPETHAVEFTWRKGGTYLNIIE